MFPVFTNNVLKPLGVKCTRCAPKDAYEYFVWAESDDHGGADKDRAMAYFD
jgi:hypothetical protein